MIALVEGANRQKTPNEIALNILLAALTIIFVFAVATLQPLAIYSKPTTPASQTPRRSTENGVTGIVMVALLVCLIPTTIGALLSAIGIAGMDRLVQRNVLAMSGRAVEAAGDVNTLLLDKTALSRWATGRPRNSFPSTGVTLRNWPTPRSCPACRRDAGGPFGRRVRQTALGSARAHSRRTRARPLGRNLATTRMSGVDLDGHQLRKGAAGSVAEWVAATAARYLTELGEMVDGISAGGGTPLVVGESPRR